MKVLWFSLTPSLYDEQKNGGWVASLERCVCKYLDDVQLAIAFEHKDNIEKKKKGTVTYYPISSKTNILTRLKESYDVSYKWTLIKDRCIEIVNDFQPDIIHCYGSEWPFGQIVKYTSVPVVIHMQGFQNIYKLSSQLSVSSYDYLKFSRFSPLFFFKIWLRQKKNKQIIAIESEIMKLNKFFMGRTNWDFNICKYYSPNSFYYHCEESIRPEIKDSPRRWKPENHKQIRLITIGSASTLKGNALILRTAKILKDSGVSFNWRVSGDKNCFKLFESQTGINHNDVNVELLGFIDAQSVTNELQNSDFYIHTAIIDNSPNSLCEAQLIGVPVISTNVGGIAQLVKDGETGLLYPYNEPHTLSFLIRGLFEDKEKQNYLSQNEMEVAHNRHDPKSIAVNLHSIYTDIINKTYLCKQQL